MNLLIPNEIIIIKNHLKDNEIDDVVFFQKRELEISIWNKKKDMSFLALFIEMTQKQWNPHSAP